MTNKFNAKLIDQTRQRQKIPFSLFFTFSVYLIIFIQLSIVMRSRSGAFHCDSTEQFITLAEQSQNKTGIFYDEKIHKKVMGKVKERKSVRIAQEIGTVSNPEIHSNEIIVPFSGFDFSPESQMQKQQRQQQQRMNIVSHRQINVGIISDSPKKIIKKLNQAFKTQYFEQQPTRRMDLVIQVKKQIITKYWIFNKDSILEDKSQLIQIYLKKCSLIYDINCSTGTINILKNDNKSNQQTINACFEFLNTQLL